MEFKKPNWDNHYKSISYYELLMIKILAFLLAFAMLAPAVLSQTTNPADRVILTKEGSAKQFSQDQIDYLQATMDDLVNIGHRDIAENINKYITRNGFSFDYKDRETAAEAYAPMGYLQINRNNHLSINQLNFRRLETG